MFMRDSKSTGPGSPRVVGFYDADTGSVQYVAIDEATRKAALIDVVLDFDPQAGRTRTDSAQEILDFVKAEGLTVEWVLDTHPHADHMMASAWLKEQTGAPNAIGEKVRDIATLWAGFYNLPDAFDPDRDFDRLFAEGDSFQLGEIEVKVMFSPGHTLGSITYVMGDAAFVHDTFMHVDAGTTRADFPGGSSKDLWDSLQAILSLLDDTRLFVGHDYPPVGDRKEPAWEATVAEHKASNKHIGGNVTEAEFRKLRDDRDATLKLPDRMLYALQSTCAAGVCWTRKATARTTSKSPRTSSERTDMEREETENGVLETWTVEEVAEAYDKGEIALIDVRTPQEYMFEHIEGALLLPMPFVQSDKLPSQDGKRLVIYCGSGMRSEKVARGCLAKGVQPITHMKGGFGAWKAAGKPHIGTDMATGAPKRVPGK